MDKVAKLHKVYGEDSTLCPASQVLQMGTKHGAKVLGLDQKIGSLETGKKADVIAIDLNQPHLTPLYDPISHLVYVVKGSDVRHVWINGRRVVSNGEIETIDTKEVFQEIHRICEPIQSVPVSSRDE
jgi:5-methylthioadenosine/S-adenosylhomocysteine deaminase